VAQGEGGGGTAALLHTAHDAGGAGQSWGRAVVLALLALLGLHSLAMAECLG
jgi:hypothetical protein